MKIEEIRQDIERIRILDALVDIVDNCTALAFVDRCVRAGAQAACIFAVNPEKICALRSDPALGQFFNSAALLLPDGIGIVGAARLLHGRRMHRTPGADLMQQICAVAPARGYRIFVLGATEHVNSAAVAALWRLHPGIRIVGRANGYFPPEENDRIIEEINASAADILFVALGSPRQEHWLEANQSKLRVHVCQGIGGTLDTIAGTVRRAPKGWQTLGLEWLYRLLIQPSRLPRFVFVPKFIAGVLRYKFSSHLEAEA